MAESKIKQPLFFKKTAVTGTIDGNGNLYITQSDLSMQIVLFAWNNQYIFIPFFSQNRWYLHVCATDIDLTAIVNHELTVDIYYVPSQSYQP